MLAPPTIGPANPPIPQNTPNAAMAVANSVPLNHFPARIIDTVYTPAKKPHHRNSVVHKRNGKLTMNGQAAWKVPRTNRAKRAMAEVRIHVSKHMKKTDDEDIWIDESVNHAILARGMQNPPRKIRVVCTREEGFPLEVKLLED